MELTDSGTIRFDIEGALKAGYSEQSVSQIAKNIDSMNQLAMNGDAYIDETFTATIYFKSPRANGQSKVVTHWYGLTEVYLNSDEANQFIAELSAAGDTATIVGMIGMLPAHIASKVSQVSGIFGFTAMLYRKQVEEAAKPGRGIIMYIQNNPDYGTQSVWFASQ